MAKVDAMASVKVLLDGDAKESSVGHQLPAVLMRQHSKAYAIVSALFEVRRAQLLCAENLHGEPSLEGVLQFALKLARLALEIAAQRGDHRRCGLFMGGSLDELEAVCEALPLMAVVFRREICVAVRLAKGGAHSESGIIKLDGYAGA